MIGSLTCTHQRPRLSHAHIHDAGYRACQQGPETPDPKVCVCVLVCVLDVRMGKARSWIWTCRSLTALAIVSVRWRHAPLCAFAFGGPQAQKPVLCLNTDVARYVARKSFATLPDWPRQDKSFDPFGASGRKHILPVRKNFFHCKKWGGRIFPP